MNERKERKMIFYISFELRVRIIDFYTFSCGFKFLKEGDKLKFCYLPYSEEQECSNNRIRKSVENSKLQIN